MRFIKKISFVLFIFLYQSSAIASSVTEDDIAFFDEVRNVLTSYKTLLEDQVIEFIEIRDRLKSGTPLDEFEPWVEGMNQKQKQDVISYINSEISTHSTIIIDDGGYIRKFFEYVAGGCSINDFFSYILEDYQKKISTRFRQLSSGQYVASPFEKYKEDQDSFGYGLARRTMLDYQNTYLILKLLYDRVQADNLSPQNKKTLRCAPVLRSFLKRGSASDFNPDRCLLDGGMFSQEKHIPEGDIPDEFTAVSLKRTLPALHKTLFSLIRTVSKRKKYPLKYLLKDFLPVPASTESIGPDLKSSSVIKKTKKNFAKKAQQRKKKQKEKKKAQRKAQYKARKAQEEAAGPVEPAALSTSAPAPSSQENSPVVAAEAVEADVAAPTMAPLSSQGPSLQLRNQNPDEGHKTFGMHARQRDLFETFWTAKKLPFRKFVTLFKGLGGSVSQLQGGSSHVKLSFPLGNGTVLKSGTWRPHPVPTLGVHSLNHLREYFGKCGLALEAPA